MLGRLFRRKPVRPDGPPGPTFRQRIVRFVLVLWNGLIALAALAGAGVAIRVGVGLWQTAGDDTATTADRLWFAAFAIAALAAAPFLLWQAWRGLRFLRYRDR